MNRIPLTELTANGDTIALDRIETPKGERLEIRSPSSSIRLDAVALEALTWQNNDTLAALSGMDTPQQPSPAPESESQIERTHLTTISNEFGFVVVSEDGAGTDVRVQLEAKKQNGSIRLCTAELKTLAEQDVDLFTQWVKTDLNG